MQIAQISMKNKTFQPTFNGKIIDAHMHVGKWGNDIFPPQALDVFIKEPLKNGDIIEKAIVSNLDCITGEKLKNELIGNKEMLEIAGKSEKIIPLAVCQPKTGNVENIKTLFREFPDKIAGLKFHPECHEYFASDSAVTPYLQFAQEKGIPSVFHSGIAWQDGKLVEEKLRYSAPKEIYKAAKRAPKGPVVLAHYGGGGPIVHNEALEVMLESIKKDDATLFTDISWVDVDDKAKPNIIKLIKSLKKTEKGDMTSRILFGSDAPIGEFATGKNGLSGKEFYEKTVEDIKTAIRSDKELASESETLIDKIFFKNAQDLFKIKETPVKEVAQKKSNNNKYIAIAFGAIAAGVTITAAIIHNKNSKEKSNCQNNFHSTSNSINIAQFDKLISKK